MFFWALASFRLLLSALILIFNSLNLKEFIYFILCGVHEMFFLNVPLHWVTDDFLFTSISSSPVFTFSHVPNIPFLTVLAHTGKASSGRSGVRGQQHDQNHRVWSIWVGHLVPLALPGGVCPPREAVHVRVLPEVHEEPNYSAKTHGLSVFIGFDPGKSLELQLYGGWFLCLLN